MSLGGAPTTPRLGSSKSGHANANVSFAVRRTVLKSTADNGSKNFTRGFYRTELYSLTIRLQYLHSRPLELLARTTKLSSEARPPLGDDSFRQVRLAANRDWLTSTCSPSHGFVGERPTRLHEVFSVGSAFIAIEHW